MSINVDSPIHKYKFNYILSSRYKKKQHSQKDDLFIADAVVADWIWVKKLYEIDPEVNLSIYFY